MTSSTLPRMGVGFLHSYVTSAELLILVVTLAASWVVLNLARWVRDVRSGPPGPWGFPVIGHLPLMGKHPHITFMNMRKTYGDVVKIRMGSWPTVVVSGRRAIRQALVEKGPDLPSSSFSKVTLTPLHIVPSSLRHNRPLHFSVP